MRELSIFADESGYLNSFYKISPYYIVTLLFHDQAVDQNPNIVRLNNSMAQLGIKDHAIHTGPLIRRESTYKNMSIEERKQIFNRIFYFTRNANVSFETLVIEKKMIAGRIELNAQLSRLLSAFLTSNLSYFTGFDKLIIYYDNGQAELTNILVSVFSSIFGNVEYRPMVPVEYRLFQSADLICTLSLLQLKMEKHELSNSEIAFFKSARTLKIVGKRYKTLESSASFPSSKTNSVGEPQNWAENWTNISGNDILISTFCGCSTMVVHLPSKQTTRVRFPSSAPFFSNSKKFQPLIF